MTDPEERPEGELPYNWREFLRGFWEGFMEGFREGRKLIGAPWSSRPRFPRRPK